jgi:acetyl-CoA acetyltransferase
MTREKEVAAFKVNRLCGSGLQAIYELHRTRGRYALVTMCIGGGQGIAAVLERL